MKNEMDNISQIQEINQLKNEMFSSINKLINNGQLDKAKELISSFENLGIALNDPEYYSIKSIVSIMENRIQDAKNYIESGLKFDDKYFDLLYTMASLYELENNNKLALLYYKKSLNCANDKNLRSRIINTIEYLDGFNNESLFCVKKPLKVLIGSSVRQKPQILEEFLLSLLELYKQNIHVDYMFVDDNEEEKSSNLLRKFTPVGSEVFILNGSKDDNYLCNNETHLWKENLIWKVADYKDKIIEYSKVHDYDYLFLIDSDIVMHPFTLLRLIFSGKDIISNIFWTKWKPDMPEFPQVWVSDQYTMFYKHRNEKLSDIEIQSRLIGYHNCLKLPGVYEVGGLGACTLISKSAIKLGISFKEIENLSFWGEDRHFCVRANAIGLKLHVDTHYPAYHIYRESELTELYAYKNNYSKLPVYNDNKDIRSNMKIENNHLVLTMLVRNEANRYLKEVLLDAIGYVDEVIILDDASTDNTIEICEKVLKDFPHTIICNKESGFNNEVELRKQLWNYAASKNPDWILCLDADETFEKKAAEILPYLINQPYYDCIAFRLYDMWDGKHYREDNYWNSHKHYRSFLIRYQRNFQYIWKETSLHCGRFPLNIDKLPTIFSDLRVKHMGWMKEEDRIKKYERYMQSDPDGQYGVLDQYKSILDLNPNLVLWDKGD